MILSNYETEEIYQILRINQQVWSNLDEEVSNEIITENSTIYDWRVSNNLLPWKKLYSVYNSIFDLSIPQEEWMKAVMPEEKRSVLELCAFIANNAKKEVFKLIKTLGNECLSASIFKSLKENLRKKGLDVSNLRPGTSISNYTDFNSLPIVIMEITKLGISLSQDINLKLKEDLSLLQKLNIFNPKRFYIDTGSIKTFRDLIERIMEENYPSTEMSK